MKLCLRHTDPTMTSNDNAMMLAAQRKNFEAGTALQDYNQAQAQDVTPLAAYTSTWTKSVLRATVNTPI